MMNENWITKKLDNFNEKKLIRHINSFDKTGGVIFQNNKRILNFSTNDYLNLSNHPYVIEKAIKATENYGAGSGSSRLVSGTLSIHEELEAKIAHHKNYPDALVFGSGYMANIGIIPSLANRKDVIISDKLVHSCILDGIKLSGAKHVRFKHNDLISLKTRLQECSDIQNKKIIVVESVYSMDGDLAPLKEIFALAEKYNALLMVDEAHATGTIGNSGRGLINQLDLESKIPFAMGTMSKGIGSYGGFIACSNNFKKLLIQEASSFIYTTALPPSTISASIAAIEIMERESSLGLDLQKKSTKFRKIMNESGIDTMNSKSQIIPIVIGDNQKTLNIAERLSKEGIIVGAIRPPTVPEGSARLRVSISLAHTEEDLIFAAEKIIKVVKA
tara:strand:- start:6782 stop:7945 length:1164 start_codon:yes stop_codon:yes gene_type:complete